MTDSPDSVTRFGGGEQPRGRGTPRTTGGFDRVQPDWKVLRTYRERGYGVRKPAGMDGAAGFTHGAIRKRANEDGWTCDEHGSLVGGAARRAAILNEAEGRGADAPAGADAARDRPETAAEGPPTVDSGGPDSLSTRHELTTDTDGGRRRRPPSPTS